MVRAVAELPHPEKFVIDFFWNQLKFFNQTGFVLIQPVKRHIFRHGYPRVLKYTVKRNGGHGWDRTNDLPIKSRLLYQLIPICNQDDTNV